MPRLLRRRARMTMTKIDTKSQTAFTQVNVFIPADTYKAAKLYAVKAGVTLKGFVGEAVAEKLKRAKA